LRKVKTIQLTFNRGQFFLGVHLEVGELPPEGGHILPQAQNFLLVETRLGVGEIFPLPLLYWNSPIFLF
jgi:hypothetical protein